MAMNVYFAIYDGDKVIGRGIKTVLVGGLKAYDEQAISAFAKHYLAIGDAF